MIIRGPCSKYNVFTPIWWYFPYVFLRRENSTPENWKGCWKFFNFWSNFVEENWLSSYPEGRTRPLIIFKKSGRYYMLSGRSYVMDVLWFGFDSIFHVFCCLSIFDFFVCFSILHVFVVSFSILHVFNFVKIYCVGTFESFRTCSKPFSKRLKRSGAETFKNVSKRFELFRNVFEKFQRKNITFFTLIFYKKKMRCLPKKIRNWKTCDL